MAGRFLLDIGQHGEAIAGYEKAARAAESVAALDQSDFETRRQLAGTYIQLGDAHAAAASSPSLSGEGRRGRWSQAKAEYQKASELFRILRAAGALRGSDDGVIESLGRQLARCDAALSR